jgi:hypothetical protein
MSDDNLILEVTPYQVGLLCSSTASGQCMQGEKRETNSDKYELIAWPKLGCVNFSL